jgi:hypothetical protein
MCKFKHLTIGQVINVNSVTNSWCGMCGHPTPDDGPIKVTYMGHMTDSNQILSDVFLRDVFLYCSVCGQEHSGIYINCEGDSSGYSIELPLIMELPVKELVEVEVERESTSDKTKPEFPSILDVVRKIKTRWW